VLSSFIVARYHALLLDNLDGYSLEENEIPDPKEDEDAFFQFLA
jgi:hypothetical protein